MNTSTPLTKLLFLTAMMVTILTVTFFALPQASSQSPTAQLHLHRGTFDARELGPLTGTQVSDQPATGPYTIIQFHGPITIEARSQLEQTGVTILEYLPDYAYLVKGTESQLAAAAALNRIYARTQFLLADKLSPPLLRAVELDQDSVGRQLIVGWPGQDDELAHDLGMLSFDADQELSLNQLMQVANLPTVRWIEPLGRPRIINDYARTIMGVNSGWQGAAIFGSGQTVGLADSGLDTGVQQTLSPDFAGRVLATYALSASGDWTDQHGHGTHVAGSLAGSGVLSGSDPAQHDYTGSFAGVAPEASLVIQGFEVAEDGSIDGIPADYYQLFSQVYSDGVRIHSNSWGDTTGPGGTSSEFGGYVFGTQRTDEFVWDHPDTTIFVGAGNSGKDGVPGPLGFCTGDGVVDLDSLLSPGTAKNVVTVGASESTRNSGPLAGYIWLLVSLCFATEPIVSDPIADNADGMAAFSSRGPADDGRVKPDVVAPGTNILSSRSHDPAAGTLWAEHDANYVYSGGTSMATPLVAGAGALVREWLTLQGAANPSAALVKAVLLNTTHDMAPGQYGTAATQEIPYSQPNSVAGWGRVDLGFMDPQPYYTLWFDDRTKGINTSDTITYSHTITQPLQVLTDTMPLRVMLTWTDPPASLSAAIKLVNDLDLVVTGPGGTYYGNGESAGDRTNNVEGIVIDNPPVGQYQITVSAYNVPIASQPYALAIGGPLGLPQPPAIVHEALTSAEAGVPLPITASVISEGPPLTATLYYSSTGDSGYTGLGMVHASGDVYSATIPSESVLVPALSYYIEATDSISTVIDGPHLVTVTVPTDPPVIVHDPVTSVDAKSSIPITAEVSSQAPPLTVTLYYSSTGNTSYTGLVMANTSGNIHTATIPPEAVIVPILSYYLEATDTNGTVVDGPHLVTVIPPSADLSITKDDGLTTASPGDPVTYTIGIKNDGPDAVVAATVTDTFPIELTAVSWICEASGGASCATSGSGDISDKVDLPAGSTLTYTVDAAFGAGAVGLVSNKATVAVPDGVVDPDPVDNSATDSTLVEAVLGGSYKQVQPSNFDGGDTLSYTIAIHNQSTRTRLVNLVDPIPNDATYVPGSGVVSDGSEPVIAGNQLTWQGVVAPGTPVYVQFAVTAASDLSIGAVITNTVTLSEDGGQVLELQAEAVHNPGYLLTINDGALFTASSVVDLRYAWGTSDGITMVQFSNDGAFPSGPDTSAWLPVSDSNPTITDWQLSTYGGYVLPRTVYARFKDDEGLPYGPIQDDIIYDPLAPEVVAVSVYDLGLTSILGADQLQDQLDLLATVVVTTSDEHSGVGSVQLSHSADFESYENYVVTAATIEISWSLHPSGQVFVRAIDRAGNVSAVEVGQGSRSYQIYLPIVLEQQ